MHKINAIFRTFLWTRCSIVSKKSPIAWDKICKPSTKGGLNVNDMTSWNRVLILKLLWNICAKADNLWVQWINAYYLKNDEIMCRNPKLNDSGIFKAILQQRALVPDLTGLWGSMLNEGKFYTNKVYNELTSDRDKVIWCNLILRNKARPRSIFTLWMTCHGGLATKARLFRFGMISNSICAFCDQEESVNHLFFECIKLNRIWKVVLHWLRIIHVPGIWSEEMSWLLRKYHGKGWKSDLVRMALAETIHECWHLRNDFIFCNGSEDKNIIERILNVIVYRGWSYPRLRAHLASLMMP